MFGWYCLLLLCFLLFDFLVTGTRNNLVVIVMNCGSWQQVVGHLGTSWARLQKYCFSYLIECTHTCI